MIAMTDAAEGTRSRADLRLGVILPSEGVGGDSGALRAFAEAVEGLGLDHLMMFDHVLGAEHRDREPPLPEGLYDETVAFREPFVTLAYLAAVTSRIELGTSVLVLPQRQTALVAKQAMEVQLLSGGRMRLAVGVGWHWVEYEGMAMPFARRGARIEEQIEVLRLLFGQDVVDFHGEFHDISRAGILPRSEVAPPIWVGGRAPAVLDRAARLADGFVTPVTGGGAVDELARLHDRLRAHGRAVEGFPVEMLVDFAAGEQDWVEQADAWAAAGGSHYTLRISDAVADYARIPRHGFDGISEYIRGLEGFVSALRG